MFLLLAAPRIALALDSSYTISADYIFFDIDKKTVSCNGNSSLVYEDLRIYADNLRVDAKSDLLEADGNIRIVSLNAPEEKPENIPTEENSIRQETASIEKEISRTRSGDTITITGDYLQYDLNLLHGMILQTNSKVQRVYFRGQDLAPSAPIQNLAKGQYYDEIERIPVTSLTAKKIRISPFSKYEAWKASLYVKDGKTVDLPYYTNDSGKITPGNWRVRRLKYSSDENFSLGLGIRYNESKRKKGFLNLDYRDKGSNHFVLGLDQQLSIGRQIGGALNISNLGGGDEALDISLNRFASGMRSQSLNMKFGRDGDSNMNFNFGSKWGASSLRGFVTSYWSAASGSPAVNANFNITPPSRYLDKKKKLSANLDSTIGYGDYDPSPPSANAFVGVSMNRYGWSAGEKGKINAGVSLGLGADTGGSRRISTGGNLSYNLNFGRRGSFTVSYRSSANFRNDGATGRGQTISTSLGLSSSAKWNTRLGASYDVLNGNLSLINGTLDYNINKKCRFATTAMYDVELSRFSANIFRINYRIDGSSINAQWYKESNEFVLDFANSFH